MSLLVQRIQQLKHQIFHQILHHPLIATGFDDTKQTELTGSDADEKDDMLIYINQDGRDKLLSIVEVFTDIKDINDASLYVEDIFEEGLLLCYLPRDADINDKNSNVAASKTNSITLRTVKQHTDKHTTFIPFRLKQYDVYRRLFYLATEARLRKGILDEVVTSTGNKHYFVVTDTKFVTPNILRLFIKSEQPLPCDDPGYAYRFALTVSHKKGLDIHSLPQKLWQKIEPKIHRFSFAPKVIHTTKQYGYLAGLEILKRRPAKRPNKVQPIGVVEKRYYTLRQLQSNTDPYAGEVDIYIHEDSAGSIWATSLQAGDTVYVDYDYEETIKNMTIGQPLFICDETSMPSVAALLERWQLDTVPIVIQITNEDAERAYFDEIVLPATLKDKLTIHHINTSDTDNTAQSVIDIIEQQKVAINCAWGAIGKADYRPIKKYLKQTHGLTGKLNRVRAYWV